MNFKKGSNPTVSGILWLEFSHCTGLMWVELSYCISFLPIFCTIPDLCCSYEKLVKELRGSIGGSCVYTWTGHWTALLSCLVSSLGVDPLTVLFSHVVESWKTHWMAPTQPKPKPKRNLWCSGMFWTFVLDLDTEWKKQKKNFHLVGALLRKRWTKMFFLKCFSWKWKKIA